MELTSCLYETNIMHCRTRPKRHKFTHKIFMFYLNLDEIDSLAKKLTLMSRNQFNIYNFADDDHFERNAKDVKTNVLEFLKSHDADLKGGKIMLLTNLRTFGYNFNPISLYFCFDENEKPVCVVPEIGNTFGEIKPFIIKQESFKDGKFRSQQKKYYYISPFIDLDIPLDFQIQIPNERLSINIDDFDKEGKFLYTTMRGQRTELNNLNLFWYSIKFPLITVKVITLIHFHALLLKLKGIAHHAKEANPQLQRGVYRVWSKNRS